MPSTGQIQTLTDPIGNTSHYYYNATTGDPASTVDAMGYTTTYATDALGRPTFVEPPMLQGTGKGYTYRYDDLDHVTAVINPNNLYAGQYQYDFVGNLVQETDANGYITTIQIPGTLDVTTICDAGNNCSTENRDTNGRRASFTDKRNVKTIYHYDKLGRVTEIDYNNNNQPPYDQRNLFYTYDTADRVTSVYDQSTGQTLTYTYGGLNNVKSEGTMGLVNGQPVSLGTAYYGYDLNDRLVAMVYDAPGTALDKHLGYSYWDDGQLHTMTNDNPGVNVTITPDGDGRRRSLTVGAVATTYSYDADSRVTAQVYSFNGNPLGDLGYNYDGDSRVIGVTGSMARTNLPPLATASYSNTEQLATWNGVSSSYDPASNITSNPASGAQYKWDSRNMMGQQTTSPTETFTYDAAGRRTGLTNPPTSYSYDGDDVVRSLTQPAAVTSDYARLPVSGEVVEAMVTNGSNPGLWVPLNDAAGSTIALIDAFSGAISTQYTYDTAGAVSTSGAANTYPYLYQGAEYDVWTGLYHTASNYYSPQLTRPLSEVGPTPSHTSGNPGSPSDIAGISGGGGSGFSGENFGKDVGIASGATGGANAIAAGLALLLSDTGFLNAIPYVGPVVFAATFFALLFDDIFSGSPSIPYQERYPGHSLVGAEKFAGARGIPDQRPFCDCPDAPSLPDGRTVDQNIAEAQQDHSFGHNWWINKVRPYGDWDYKHYPGGWQKWDYAGNFNFGATGRAAGQDETHLLRAAAFLQMVNGTWQGGLNNKFAAIRAGEKYYECGCFQQ